ncbi:MAG TPA: nuclear transport factor 2 family protein [Longimicrobiaceae bacterium]|nr:nuclear transport factor 2 family protein [Longimicrobiaceae bacterium]
MSRVSLITIALLLAAGTTRAQTAVARPPANRADSALVATELSMWGMWKNRDAASFARLLADDFFDVFLDGTVVNKQQLMQEFTQAELLDYSFSPVSVVHLTPNAVVMVYRAQLHGRQGMADIHRTVDVTSGWARRNGRWLSVFYRETNPPPAP